MENKIHILLLEDEPLDGELAIAALEEAGVTCTWERVETKDSFLEQIETENYDLILADYQLPTFDGLSALQLFTKYKFNIPFIIVSGTLGEELAIESLKAGATDYVLKQRLERLAPVVKRALREKQEQQLRKEAEAELKKLSQALKQSSVSVVITDTNGDIEFVNHKFTQVTGYSFDEVTGKNPRILKTGHTSPAEYEKLWQTISAGKEWQGEFYNKRKDGTFFWESASITAITDASSNITHYLAVKEDISVRKRLEEQARQHDRLATVGQLAAGIAHDFNNILAVISLYSDLLASDDLSEECVQKVNTISRQSKRAADLIQQILDFSRRAILERVPINLTTQLKEFVQLWQRTLPDNINLTLSYDSLEHTIFADSTRIQQMMMNLVINSRDAMPNGGELSIILRNKKKPICIRDEIIEPETDNWVQIIVSDTGTGIPKDVIPHLYEPFFTTKEPGKGTGLGLAQVYGIVKQHKGYITVESDLSSGTQFSICFPAYKEIQPKNESSQASIPSGNNEVILVVEDDDITRGALVDSLEALNYQVVTALNGQEALDYFSGAPNIDLIICDRAMPGMSGERLFESLSDLNCDIPFVLMSGYIMEKELAHFRRKGIVDWLQKPLRLEQLAKVVANAI